MNDPITETVTMRAVSAPNMVASAIHGAGNPVRLEHAGYVCLVRRGREFNELDFWADGARPLWATVTIRRDDEGRATVSHSSSSSRGTLADAAATTHVLAFAIEVAEQLNRWADA